MSDLLTPGVYARPSATEPALRALRTDVAGFVGVAEFGPLHSPRRLGSWEEYRRVFGGPLVGAHLPSAVRAFFDNGGRTCWVVRAADPAAQRAVVDVPSPGLPARIRIEASSPGAWGNRLTVTVVHRVIAATRPRAGASPGTTGVVSTAHLFPGSAVRIRRPSGVEAWAVVESLDALRREVRWTAPVAVGVEAVLEVVVFSISVHERGRLVEHHGGLTQRSSSMALGDALLDAERTLQEQSRRIRLVEQALAPTDLPSEGRHSLMGGTDGLASLLPEHLVGDPESPIPYGLATLAEVHEVSLVAVPDAVLQPLVEAEALPEEPPPPPSCDPGSERASARPPPSPGSAFERPPGFARADILSMQRATLEHCRVAADRFALLDAPAPRMEVGELLDWRREFDSSYGAAFHPWLTLPHATGRGTSSVPPSGHVAGAFAWTDLSAGVHAVAANRALSGMAGLTALVDERAQAVLNPVGINCIRSFRGRGIRIFGARTLSSDTPLRYINVRRVLLMLRESLEEQLAWAVFERHTSVLRHKLKIVITGYLRALWVSGALRGDSLDQAFFVRCDESNNPTESVERGELHALLGVAIVRPAEFVLLRLGRTERGLAIEEEGDPWR